MLDYIMRNPILFYGVFAIVSLVFLIILAVVINKIRISKERKRLKKTSDSILNEHFEEENIDDEKFELEKAIEELEKKAEEKNPQNLVESFKEEPKIVEETTMEDVLSKMKDDLTKKDEKKIYEFEQEQEETAIISYRELLEANGFSEEAYEKRKQLEEETEIPKHSIEIPKLATASSLEVINIDTIEEENKYDKFNLETEIKDIKKSIIKEEKIDDNNKKFRMTEFLSPVYGKIEDKLEYPTIPNIEKVREKRISDLKNEDFLSALKAFRQNL